MNPFEELKTMKNVDGVEVRFVKFLKVGYIQVWQKGTTIGKEEEYISRVIDLTKHEIPIEELKQAGIWDVLDTKVQDDIANQIVKAKEEVVEKMAVMRQKRVNRYASLPKEITCGCGKVIKPNYTQLQHKADKMKIPLADVVKNVKCRKCNPFRGRPKREGAVQAEFLTCKCGFKTKANYSFIGKKVLAMGITVEDYVKGYVCQTCVPTKGRQKKERVV